MPLLAARPDEEPVDTLDVTAALPTRRVQAPADDTDGKDDEDWEAEVARAARAGRRTRRRGRRTTTWLVPLLLAGLLGGGAWAYVHHGVGLGSQPETDPVPPQYRVLVEKAGTRCPGVSAALIGAQIDAESSWNPQASSPAGAQGIAQFTPEAWAHYGKDHDRDGTADPLDPADAIPSQAEFMCALNARMSRLKSRGYVEGDLRDLTLAGYNAGPERVVQARGVPNIAETRGYVERIEKLVPRYEKWLPPAR